MFSTPLIKIFLVFWRNRAALEGETKKDECRVLLDGVHLEICCVPSVKKGTDRAFSRRKLSMRVYANNKKDGGAFTELTQWEKIAAFLFVRRLHRLSRRNTRAEQVRLLPCFHALDAGVKK